LIDAGSRRRSASQIIDRPRATGAAASRRSTLQAGATLIEALREEVRAQAAPLICLRSARDALRRLREASRGPILEDAQAAFRRLFIGVGSRRRSASQIVDISSTRGIISSRLPTPGASSTVASATR
jgi:hypothetical protein